MPQKRRKGAVSRALSVIREAVTVLLAGAELDVAGRTRLVVGDRARGRIEDAVAAERRDLDRDVLDPGVVRELQLRQVRTHVTGRVVGVERLDARHGGADVGLRGRLVGPAAEAEVRGDRNCQQDPDDDDDHEELDQGETLLVSREATPKTSKHALLLRLIAVARCSSPYRPWGWRGLAPIGGSGRKADRLPRPRPLRLSASSPAASSAADPPPAPFAAARRNPGAPSSPFPAAPRPTGLRPAARRKRRGLDRAIGRPEGARLRGRQWDRPSVDDRFDRPKQAKFKQPSHDRTLLPVLGCRFTAAVDAPGNQTKGVVMNARRAVSTVAGLAILLAGITLGTAAASPIKWVSVPMGTHQFGQLRTPDVIVAHAGPNEVGFKK